MGENKPEEWRVSRKDDHDAQQANAAGLQLRTASQRSGNGNNNAAHESNEKRCSHDPSILKKAHTDLGLVLRLHPAHLGGGRHDGAARKADGHLDPLTRQHARLGVEQRSAGGGAA